MDKTGGEPIGDEDDDYSGLGKKLKEQYLNAWSSMENVEEYFKPA